MRIAHIRQGVVVNVFEASAVWSSDAGSSYMESNDASIGWVVVDGVLTEPPKDYIEISEAYIKEKFSTAKLLQCKVWLDILPHESTPKLMSLFQWTGQVTAMALQESEDFPQPPVTFIEVAQECIPLL